MAKVAVIGSGPAGCTASLYLARAGVEVDFYVGDKGGQLMSTTSIENFPSYPDISGADLMGKMLSHALSYPLVKERVGTVCAVFEGKTLPTKVSSVVAGGALEMNEYNAVIVASGSSPKKLDAELTDSVGGIGISYCSVCDAQFSRGKPVVVVGGGNSAMTDAIYLSRFASKVTLVVRGLRLKGEKVLIDKVNKDIEVIYNHQVKKLEGDKVTGLTGVVISNKDGEERVLPAFSLFVAIGHKPNTDFLPEADRPSGDVFGSRGNTTTLQRVFVAGDVSGRNYRQAIVSAGDGCKAALDVVSELTKSGEL